MGTFIIVIILIAMLLFFVWSNYSHIKILCKMELKLKYSRNDLENSYKLYNSNIYIFNNDILKLGVLENKLISKQLSVAKKENYSSERKEKLNRAFKKISPPSNQEIKKNDEEINFYMKRQYSLMVIPNKNNVKNRQGDRTDRH